MRTTSKLLVAVGLGLVPAVANAQADGDIRIAVEHAGNTDFSLTPLWFGFHNGAFDTFDTGLAASPALEAIAELGLTGPITADFTAAPGVPGDIQGVVAAADNGVPPIEPGETGVGFVTPINPASYQYFSFLSMLVPTNDTFIGNGDPFALQIFNGAGDLIDENGMLTSERVIQIFDTSIYDAGTELNDGVGAAFTQGVDGTLGNEENGVVTLGSDLSAFIGATDVTGRVINDGIAPGELLATISISIVPEPTTAVLMTASVIGVAFRRR
ncbi:MAG: spondin domain-containing protein [Planctomycetota bacterium]